MSKVAWILGKLALIILFGYFASKIIGYWIIQSVLLKRDRFFEAVFCPSYPIFPLK